MTKLEEEMWEVLCETDYALAAAEVAKKYIEKAFDAGADADKQTEYERDNFFLPYKKKWLKENGITE